MTTQEERNEKIAETLAASQSKSALVEKITFAGIPILFSCVVYLMTSLSSANNEIIQLKSKVNIVVNADNKAIPPQGTTIDMAEIREKLTQRIDQVEKEAALARGNMTLEREKQLAALEKQRMDMMAEAASARAAIRSDGAALTTKMVGELSDKVDLNDKNAALARATLDRTINDRIDELQRTSSLARAELDKRIALLDQELSFYRELSGKKR
jgi:hypothetical protein